MVCSASEEDVIFQKKKSQIDLSYHEKPSWSLKKKDEWVEQNKRKQRKKNGRKVKHKWKQMSSHIVENRYSHEQCAHLLCLHWNLVFFYVSDSACFQCSTNKDKSKLLLHKLGIGFTLIKVGVVLKRRILLQKIKRICL
jgi:hypothetical protein